MTIAEMIRNLLCCFDQCKIEWTSREDNEKVHKLGQLGFKSSCNSPFVQTLAYY